MNIWITGSAGFLGARLAAALSADGHRLLGISRRPTPGVDAFAELDLGEEDAARRVAQLEEEHGRPDAVIHAAGRLPGRFSMSEYVHSNVEAMAHLLDGLSELPPRRFIYTSTLTVYGRPARNPVVESDPVDPFTLFAATKLWGEQLLGFFQHRCEVLILRLPSLYGAGQADSFIDGLARTLQSGERLDLFALGRTQRDTLFVDEAVGAIRAGLGAALPEQLTLLNLGNAQPTSTLEYARLLAQALNSSSPILPVERTTQAQVTLYADISAARRVLGFAPLPVPEAFKRYARELAERNALPPES